MELKKGLFIIKPRDIQEDKILNVEDLKYIKSMKINPRIGYRINQKYKRQKQKKDKIILNWRQNANRY